MTEDLWIVIPGWDRFQHYRDRQPPWIKVYTDLLHRDEYLSLTGDQRAILHGLWLEYASSSRRLRADTRSLTSRLRLRVTSAQLECLNHAGFIEFSASKPLAERLQDASASRAREETEAERETETQDLEGSNVDTSLYDVRPLDQASTNGTSPHQPEREPEPSEPGGDDLFTTEKIPTYEPKELY